MAQFVLTAKSDKTLGGGQCIVRGESFRITIPMMGITPVNLFHNSRCADTILKEFKRHNIDLPKNSPLLNGGNWDIKME